MGMTDPRFTLFFHVLSALPHGSPSPLSTMSVADINFSGPEAGRGEAETHRAAKNKQLLARTEGGAVAVSMNEDAQWGRGRSPLEFL